MRAICVLCLSLVAVSAIADELLWEKLRRDANMIVLMRNSESNGNRDGGNMLAWDASGKCEGESTLTAEGKSQAKRIGVAFAEHGIRPTVISSPMCRCTETAQIAFGKYSTDPDLRQKPTADALGQEMFQARASELLRQNRGNAPIVFVNHRPNIDSLTMELIDIGELLIGSVTEDGEVEVIGKIRVEP
jgi:phosphohistidine phosphatase SixA